MIILWNNSTIDLDSANLLQVYIAYETNLCFKIKSVCKILIAKVMNTYKRSY